MTQQFKFHNKQNRFVPAQTMSELIAAQKAKVRSIAAKVESAAAKVESVAAKVESATSPTPVVHTDVSAGQSTITPSTTPPSTGSTTSTTSTSTTSTDSTTSTAPKGSAT